MPKAGTARSIYLGLREQIAGGVYLPGDRLPSTRTLAEEFGVSRTTVTAAFEQLISEGYVSVRQGAKATVARNAPNPIAPPTQRPGGSVKTLSAYAMRAMDLLPHLPGTADLKYDFRYGDVAPDDFPKLLWRKALTAAVIARRARLGYGHPAGSPVLRQALQGYLWRARGIRCQAEQIVVTNGSQQALDLCARALLNPGDRVLIEEPCYAMARNVFVTLGAQATPVACDDDGLKTDRLPDPLSHALAFVTPSHQFPLGGVLSVGRRRQLVEWAEAADAHVIEDDYDGEYRYDVRPIPPLYLSGRDRVIYIGTVSKTLSPTLRLGYLVLPEALVEPFVRCKQITDRHGATFEQEALASLIETGAYERHVRKMRRLNSVRRTAFLDAMQQTFSDKVEIVGTSAGLHVVVWFNSIGRREESGLAATAREAGIGIYPISRLFSCDTERRAGFVFGYASIEARKIADGVKLLYSVLTL
ncbi:PLP-dependent aminotransferase family protein [Pararhizobium sp. YC-54]|uniref:MocR-like pyridoxine biosynthesis transcription factor PdxR n=1 Tax=Pararhizobium sp. YC-54 TaxID=2986920 RepID=UPI0021F7003A|nr:PLP-dependent aminotransferase family protein [Pararhizobium sp. YC-54]MCV9999306.1 PLP-dependent aminotransferase family protein [Pararhizobium sp. YC-54]